MPRLPVSLALLLASSIPVAHAAPTDGPAEDFAEAVHQRTGYFHRGWVLDRLTTFELPDACWERMLDPKQRALATADTYARSIASYAAKVTGEESWDRIEGTTGREKKKHLVEELIERLRPHFHVTILHEGDDCDVGTSSLFLKYWNTLGTTLVAHPPPSDRVAIMLHVTPRVKDVTVDVSRDGSKFVITAPSERDVVDWHAKLTKPFAKAARPPRK